MPANKRTKIDEVKEQLWNDSVLIANVAQATTMERADRERARQMERYQRNPERGLAVAPSTRMPKEVRYEEAANPEVVFNFSNERAEKSEQFAGSENIASPVNYNCKNGVATDSSLQVAGAFSSTTIAIMSNANVDKMRADIEKLKETLEQLSPPERRR